jgi:hypothetical protein
MPDTRGRRVVFFSHKWCPRDVAVVTKIIDALTKRGVVANSLLVDPVVPSHSILGTETARIDDADCFVVLWTPEASRSVGVNREIKRARETGRDIVLLRWFDTPLPSWYDPDRAYVKIEGALALPCGPEAVPTFPGLIDRILGFKDIGTVIAAQVLQYLDSQGQRPVTATSLPESLPPERPPKRFKGYPTEMSLFNHSLKVRATEHAEFHASLPKGAKVTGLLRELSGLSFDFYIMDQRNYAKFCEDRGGSAIYSEFDVVAFDLKKTLPKEANWYFVVDTFQKQADRVVWVELRALTPGE